MGSRSPQIWSKVGAASNLLQLKLPVPHPPSLLMLLGPFEPKLLNVSRIPLQRSAQPGLIKLHVPTLGPVQLH